MAQLDALNLAESLRARMVDFAVDDNFVRDSDLANIARDIWSGPATLGGLVSDLWVEGAFPSKTSPVTLDDLVVAGQFDADLRDVLHKAAAMPRDRLLYTHQHEAIGIAQSGTPGQQPAIVVTAGTGAGKTESFLLPILNDLYRNPPTNRRGGTRCIILYPMNALVNDQVDRLYGWLKEQTRTTLFHFTSETPEDIKAADDQDVPIWGPCRMRTRQEARGHETHSGHHIEGGPTPDIVITNYSMLEYMLCRPQDSIFFGPELRAIVLDEAHLYTGTLAAEITLLLRRLLLRCGRKPEDVLHFATSATLGSGDQDELKDFAGQVFGKPTQLIRLITGEPARTELTTQSPPDVAVTAADINARQWLDGPTIIDNQGDLELAISPSCKQLEEDLAILVSRNHLQTMDTEENRPAVVLRESLPAAPVVHQMEAILWDKKHVSLAELGEEIWGDDSPESLHAVIQLLQLTASARYAPTSYPLVPHRIHVMARPADCLSVCLNVHCVGNGKKLPSLGTVSAGYHDTCEFCSSRTLSLERCRNCGEWLLAGQEREKGAAIVASFPKVRRDEDDEDAAQHRLLFRPISDPDTVSGTVKYVDPDTGEFRGIGSAGTVHLNEHSGCPNCEADKSQITSFYSGAPLTLSILAETLLSELPEFPSPGGSNEWLPAQGRRLLAFSDSRREAARLGPMLTNQHEQQLVRAAIVESLGQGVDLNVVRRLQRDLERDKQDLEEPNISLAERQFLQNRVRQNEQDVARHSEGGSVEWWSQSLGMSALLGQVLDRATGDEHNVDRWSQAVWEDNRSEVTQRVKELLGRELARPNRGASLTLEPLGLIEVAYPGLDLMQPPNSFKGTLPTESVRRSVSEIWPGLLAALCDTLRTDGVVTLGNEDLDDGYDFGRILIGRWAAENEELRTQRGLIRFVGATQRQRRRQFAADVLRNCGMTDEDQISHFSERLLRACFNQLLEAAKGQQWPWLESGSRQTQSGITADAIRIKFFELSLRSPLRLFQCSKTGHVWPRSVAGCAPETGCCGTLEPVSDGDLDCDLLLGRRRREYQGSPIFKIGLWGEEHSAQLDPKENRRLQNLFKAGIRNVLSSTTTLELGIDIGGLNGVLMGNVPPGKANYLQRAGRAGRRADGSSVVTTFARPRPYDREVFQRIGAYLDAPLRRPMVFLDRERVVRRHIHAFLLGEFFRTVYSPDQHTGAMDAYGRMGAFCAMPRTGWWERGNSNKPQIQESDRTASLRMQFTAFLNELKAQNKSDANSQIDGLTVGTVMDVAPTDWAELIDDVATAFEDACSDWERDYLALLGQWEKADTRPQANALNYQLRLWGDTTVIEALSDRQFLPRYGFPIGVLKLRVARPDEEHDGRIREEDQFRLERQGLLALREYVPGSQLLAGGKLVTSHGILKHWTGEDIDTAVGFRGQYTKCIKGHLHYWKSQGPQPHCPFCGEVAGRSPTPYILPRYGFSAATWDPPKWSSATPESIGEVETVSASFTVAAGDYPIHDDFGSVAGLSARYRENGELLVYNEGRHKKGFAICLRCGYADSEREFKDGRVGLPSGFGGHSPLNAQRIRRGDRRGQFPICPTAAPVLRNQTLAASETTDVLLLDFTRCLFPHDLQNDETLVTTLGYALHRAAAQLLQLDSRELGVATMPAGAGGLGLGVLLYDNVPGGAGHVRELLAIGGEWLERAKAVLYVDESHDSRCQSACLECLLSFQTQNAMQQGLLNRRQAFSVLSSLLDGTQASESAEVSVESNVNNGEAMRQSATVAANEERIQRVANRRERRKRS